MNKRVPEYSVAELIETGNQLIPVVSYMWRAKDVPSNGFDFRLKIASDSLFFYKIAEGGSIFIIPEELSVYRSYDSHARKTGYMDDSLVSLCLLEYEFPNYWKSINIAKSKLYERLGSKYYDSNQKNKALGMFRLALINHFSWKVACYYAGIRLGVWGFLYSVYTQLRYGRNT